MTNSANYYTHKVEGKVDLQLISKYHDAVKILIDANQQSTVNEYNAEIDIVIRTIKGEVSEEYHYAYDYLDIDETLLPGNHSNNLLYLVHSQIQWEWALYNENVLDDNDNKEFYSKQPGKYDLAKGLKQDLHDLILLMEAQRDLNPKDIQIALMLPSKDLGSKAPSNLSFKATSHIIQELVTEKFNELRRNYGFYKTIALYKSKKPVYKALVDLHSELSEYDFKPEKALNLFRRLVVITARKYLNDEGISLTPENEDLTQEQARIIYPLLASFNLLNTEEHIDKHTTLRDRARYVRSIIKTPEYNKKDRHAIIKTFPTIEITD